MDTTAALDAFRWLTEHAPRGLPHHMHVWLPHVAIALLIVLL